MSNWQDELAQGFANSKQLLAFLDIDPNLASLAAEQEFNTKVPMGFALRMQKGRLDDPLLRQVLAAADEELLAPGYSKDPLQESSYNPMPGLIHKYPNRVLFMLSGTCAVHCRYCFRRHFPYADNRPGKQGISDLVNYLMQHPEVDEVILSGGDPLLLNNHYFKYLCDALVSCPNILTLRIHSRVPIVLPSRIEPNWLKLMDLYPWKKVMVVHCNHANELDASVKQATEQLREHEWMILNQSVLLAGVNDEVTSLVALSQKLWNFSILPYYLHLLDPVQGAAHFSIPRPQISHLYRSIQTKLPGYLVPRLVQEVPGLLHKSLIKYDD